MKVILGTWRRLAMAAALLLAACGGATGVSESTGPVAATTTSELTATSEASPQPDEAFPVTVEAANGAVTIAAPPQRIVSLSATHTEILFELGAGDQVVAVDVFSNHPSAVSELPQVDAFQLNVEAVVGFAPDLVILAFDPGEAVEAFRAVGVPTLLFDAPITLADAYAQIEAVGRAAGHARQAAAMVDTIEEGIAAAVDQAPDATGLSYYYELDPTFYSVTSATFVGSLFALFGMDNIADPADLEGFGYPQLSAEAIIAADPDLIFLADSICCAQDAAAVAARPGWGELTALQTDGVVVLDDDIASRWGPRLVDLVEAIAAGVQQRAGATR